MTKLKYGQKLKHVNIKLPEFSNHTIAAKEMLFFGNTLSSIWRQRDMMYATHSQMSQKKSI